MRSMAEGDGLGLALVVEDLVVSGADGGVLLEIPALTIEPGGCVGVRGPSGAGKSTLLHALAGMSDDVSGAVIWGGKDILRFAPSGRAAFRCEHIGLIFQEFLLFEELGALGNAALSAAYAPAVDRANIRMRAAGALTEMGLGRYLGGRSVERFSGGERQRVAVARALAGSPGILLADEPTASLDRAAADRLIDDLLDGVARTGRTLIAVSHDAALHARMDRVLTIDDGRIVADSADPSADG